MFKNVLFIAKKDFFYSLKDKSLLVWMFIMPLVFFGFIGSTTGGLGGSSGPSNIAVWESVEGMSENNQLAKQIIHNLKKENYNVVIFNKENDLEERKYHFKNYSRRLWLPKDMLKDIANEEVITIEYASKATGIGNDKDQFAIEKSIYQTLGDILIFKKLNDTSENLDFTQINDLSKNIQVKIESAGEKLNIPSGFNQAVPGILVMFIMMIALTSGSVGLFLERQSGVLKRLAAAPLTRKEIVYGKWLGKWFMTILQLIYGMLMGWLLFKIHWGEHIVAIFIVLLIWAAFNAALAILLGSIAKSEGQVSLIATVSSLLLAALGGCWWPIEITPEWMQSLANFLPTGWIMNILHKLMYFGAQLSDITIQVVALIVISIFALNVAFKKFQFE